MQLPSKILQWISLSRFLNASSSTWFWCVIALTAFGLECGALFYQHVLETLPCQLCIYVRVWLMGLLLTSLLALWLKRWFVTQLLMLLTVLALSIGLANETWNLIVVEYGIGDGGGCGFFANFPSWAPLDKWLPFMFEVQEFCQATPEIIFGITMAHSLAAVCFFLIALISIALVGLVKSKFD